jgi:hypothetical protein
LLLLILTKVRNELQKSFLKHASCWRADRVQIDEIKTIQNTGMIAE